MKILLSNDDGIFAPGLQILADTMGTLAELKVVAPDRNRSGASNSLTLQYPVFFKEIRSNWFSVEGTPTDCVHLAVTGLFKETFDMVISGINAGENVADDLWYSGTVAAAMEGRFLGLPAIAVSLYGHEQKHYETAARVVHKLVGHLQKNPLAGSTILNVNVPDVPYEDLKGIAITRCGTRHAAQPSIKDISPRGRDMFWVGLPGKMADNGPGTDFAAIAEQKVSITPVNLDLTDYRSFDNLAGWVDKIKYYENN